MGSINRGLVWSLLPRLPTLFPSVNQAVNWLKSEGKSWDQNVMWRDVSTAFQAFRNAPLQRGIPSDEVIPKSLFIERDYRNPNNYYYYGTARFRDPETGEVYDRGYSLYTNRAMSDEELAETAYWDDLYESSDPDRSWKIESFTTISAYHKWGAAY